MAVTVEIDGIGRVQLDDAFRSLSPEQQRATIDEIVRSAGGGAPSIEQLSAPEPAGGPMQGTAPASDVQAPRRPSTPTERVRAAYGLPEPGAEGAEPAGGSGLGGMLTDTAQRVAGQVAGGFNQSLGDMAWGLSYPGEKAMQAVGGALGFEPPRTPLRVLGDWLRSPQMTGPEPEIASDRILRRGGEVLGETVLPMGALGGLARAGVGQGVAALAETPLAQRLAGGILDAYRTAPGASIASEAISGLGAGIGGGVMRETGVGPTGELAGEIAGGVAAPVLATHNIPALVGRGVRAGRNIYRQYLTEEGITDRATDAVASRLREGLESDTVRQNLEQARQVREQIPGFEPSLAQQTDLPSLISTQRSIETKASGPEFDEAVSRRAANLEAIDRFRQSAAPEGEPDAEAAIAPLIRDRAAAGTKLRELEIERQAIDEQRRELAQWASEQRATTQSAASDSVVEAAEETARLDIAMRALNDQEKSALQALERNFVDERRAFALNLRPTQRLDRSAFGGRIRGEIEEARRARSAEMARLASQLGINDADFSVPFESFEQSIRQWRGEMRLPSQRENMPNSLRDVEAIAEGIRRLRAGEPGGRPATFQDIKALREGVNVEIMELARDTGPGHRRRLANAVALKQRIDDILLGEEIEGISPTLVENYQTFRQRYFEDFIKPFERGTVLDTKKRDGTGFFRTLDEEIVSGFLDSQDAARQFKDILGSNRAAMGDLVAVALDDLADAAIRQGIVEPRGIETWLRRRGGALQELPELKAAVDRIKADVDEAFARHEQTEAALRDRVATERRNLLAQRDATRAGRIEDRRRQLTAREDIARQKAERDAALVAAQRRLDEAMTPLRERLGILTERQMAREDQSLARALGSIEGGQGTEADLINRALGSPRLMMNMRAKLASEPEALAALRRKVWDDVATLDGDALGQFMVDHEKSLRLLFSEEHLRNLSVIADAMRIMARVPEPSRGAPISADLIDDIQRATGFNPMQFSSRWVNINSGRLSVRVAGFDFLMRTLNARRRGVAEKLLKSAIYDAGVADALINRINHKATPEKLPRAITAWLASRGYYHYADEAQEE